MVLIALPLLFAVAALGVTAAATAAATAAVVAAAGVLFEPLANEAAVGTWPRRSRGLFPCTDSEAPNRDKNASPLISERLAESAVLVVPPAPTPTPAAEEEGEEGEEGDPYR
jgi:hypothetical protein